MAGKPKLTGGEAAAIAWAYRNGTPGTTLADRYGVSYQTVMAYLRRQGVEIRGRFGRAR